jgi:hypothetical protein
MIFIPLESIDLANCLASLSVGNVLACLADGGFNRPCFGASTETNHRLVVVPLANIVTLLFYFLRIA